MNLAGSVRMNRRAVLVIVCLLLVLVMVRIHHAGGWSHTLWSFGKQTDTVSHKVNLERVLAVAIEVAERGGREVRQVRKDTALGVKWKGRTREGVLDPLTLGDLRSHQQMFHGLKTVFPALHVISEERSGQVDADMKVAAISTGALDDMTASVTSSLSTTETTNILADIDDVTVWIDPLDATKEYTENLLHYVTTMVCVAVRGRPIIGVIHQPFNGTGVTYWAWLGRGHSATVSPVTRPSTPPRPVKVLVSRSHAGATLELASKAFSDVKQVVAAGAGFKTLSLLSGRGDVYVHATHIKKWDTCAPTAILSAVGGRATDLLSSDIAYDGDERRKNELIEGGLLAALHHHDKYAADMRRIRGAEVRHSSPPRS